MNKLSIANLPDLRVHGRRWSSPTAIWQGIARLIADALMINFALILGLILRDLWLLDVQNSPVAIKALVHNDVQELVLSSAALTIISLPLFFLSGFYTRGRTYHGRYKALVVAQAVTVAYLIFGAGLYFLAHNQIVARGAVIIAWALSLALLLGSRLWSRVWVNLARTERRLHAPPPSQRPIQTVLVIGGDGYIGSALLPKLLEKGYRVRVLSLFLYGYDSIAELMAHPQLEIVHSDFRQIDRVVEAMQDVDAVVHLGAIVGDPACALDEQLTIDVNLMATRMIAEVAKGYGVNRFIVASTCSVYGASDQVLNEHSALNPVSLYARTKIACERVLKMLADDNFSPVILRFGTIYGLSGRTRFDLVVNLLTAKAVVDGEITVQGGDQWRPFLHVDDAALGVLKALEAPLAAVRNEIFNVGSDEQNYLIGDVGQAIQRLVPSAKLVELDFHEDRRNYRVSFAKIRRVLEFTPQWTLEQGTQQVIDALRTGKVHDYRDPKYSNVKFLSEEGILLFQRREENWANTLVNDLTNETAASEAVALR